MKVVTLRGGKGPKEKYNGARAKLGRRKGGWVTVTTASVVTGRLGEENNHISIAIDDPEDEKATSTRSSGSSDRRLSSCWLPSPASEFSTSDVARGN